MRVKLPLAACWGAKTKNQVGCLNWKKVHQRWKGWSKKSLRDTKEMSLISSGTSQTARSPHFYPNQVLHELCYTKLGLSEQNGACHQCHHSPGAGTAHSDMLMSPKGAVTSLSSPASNTNWANLSCHTWEVTEASFWGHYNQPKVRIQCWSPTTNPQTSPPKTTKWKTVIKELKLPFNLYFLTWKINFTTIRCSASQRNCWVLAKGTWRIPRMPCAFPVCQHMEWGHSNNGPFHLLDSSAAQNVPPPLSWHWYHPSSFQKKSQLDGKKEKLDLQHGLFHVMCSTALLCH